MKYHFKVAKEKQGYSAYCMELQGCQTQGDTKEELHQNMLESLNLHLAEPANSKVIFPFPKKRLRGRNIVEVSVKPEIAFSFYLRSLRIRSKLTQKEVATRMGIKNIFAYQKLESAKTANPELKTIARIKEVFPDFDLDEVV
jgi:antitoxin HicB